MSKRPRTKNRAATAPTRSRHRWWTASIVAVSLSVAGLIGYTVYMDQRPATWKTPLGTNAAGDGLVIGKGPVTVEVYQDYLCPFCKKFHEGPGSLLTQMAQADQIALTVHPIAFLDKKSTNKYSSRAVTAAACAADEGKFAEFNDALFAAQPREGSAGPGAAELIASGTRLGLSDRFEACVRSGTYGSWTKHVTDLAGRKGVTGTPSIFVNGTKVDASFDAVQAAIAAAAPQP